MKYIVFIPALIAAMFAATEAKAVWSSAENRWFTEFTAEKARFPNGYASTVWGALSNPPDHHDVRSDDHVPYMSAIVRSKSFRTGWLEANMIVQSARDNEARRTKAPLLIILPGIFNDAQGDVTVGMATFFWRKGYHVVALPNPWSPRYIRHKPLTKPGNLITDSKVALEIIRGMIAKIGTENVTSISLMGESYGGILAAAVYATDQVSAAPMINGKVMLVSPPLNLRDGADRLDLGMDKNEVRYKECSSLSILWTVFKKMMADPLATQANLNTKVLSCMEPLVYRNFQEFLTESVGAMRTSFFQEAGNDEFVPDSEAEARNTPRVVGTRFRKVFYGLMPENVHLLNSPIGDLSYWTNLLPEEALDRLRIVSARDDLLNIGKSWNESESAAFSNRTTFLLPWGGHLGFEASPSFRTLLDIVYPSTG